MNRSNNLGIAFTGSPYTVREIATLAHLAEIAGFSSFWFAEDYFLRDAVSNIACVANATKKIKLSTGVVNPFSRNPVLIAQTIATLNELSRNRIRLAIGTGVLPLIESMGLQVKQPLLALRESVEIIRSLLLGKRIDFPGKIFVAKGVKLGENPYFGLLSPNLTFRVVPVYVAAIGPSMLKLAGEISDGVLLTAGFAPENVRAAIPLIDEGARKSGKTILDLKVACYIATCRGKPSKALKGFVAFNVAYGRLAHMIEAGIKQEDASKIRKNVEAHGLASAGDLVRNDIIEKFAAYGTMKEIKSKIQEFRASGVTEPVILPMDTNVRTLIHNF